MTLKPPNTPTDDLSSLLDFELAQLPYNAWAYGATGEGISNETASLQRGLDAAAGANFEIPIGTYKTTCAAGTATTAVGSYSLTSVTPTTGWVNGEPIHGEGIPIGTTIASGAGTATMVMSAPATIANTLVPIKTCLLVRANTTVTCHKYAQFNVTGTGNAVEFYTATRRTPVTGFTLPANTVESAEVIPLSTVSAASFAVGNFVQLRDSYTLGGEICHRETNIVEYVVAGTATATTTNTSPNLTLVSPASTANTTTSSTSLTAVAPTTGWSNGMIVTGSGIPSGTTIVSGAGTATMVMSAASSSTQTGIAISSGWYNGMLVTGTNIPAGTYIVSGAGTATMVMSQNATNTTAGVTITGSGIWLKYPVNYAYLTSLSAAISIVSPADNTHWKCGKFDLTGVVSNVGGADRDVFYIEWGSNCSIEDITAVNYPNKVINFYACVNCHQRRIVAYLPSAVGPGEGYGCRLEYSRDCSIRQVWGRSIRHTADLSGGSDCLVDGVFSTGGVVASQIAAFIHGLESKRHRVINVFASNVETAFGAGNGTFGGDFDFVAEGIVSHRCDTSVAIINGCSGWTVRAQTKNSTIRAGTVDNSTNGYFEVTCDGIVTNPSGYGAVTVSGTSGDIVIKPRIRNPIFKGVAITATATAGKITILDADIDMGTVNANGIDATSLVATSKVLVSGGTIKMNNVNPSAISLTGPAGSELAVERGTQITGTMLRGIVMLGGSTDQIVKGTKFRGTISEQVRVEAGTVHIGGGADFTTGTAIRMATAATALFIGDVDLSAATTKLSNTAAASVTGGDALRHITPVTLNSTDAAFTLTPSASSESTYFTAVMAANRIVTLSTTNAYLGARFNITRTAASTGAFTLDVGTGPLKSLAVSQWCQVTYNGAAWVLTAFGSL